MATPSNQRNPLARKTGGKAGGRAGRPSGRIARPTSTTPKSPDPWKGQSPKTSRTAAPKGNTTFRPQNTPLTLPNSARAGVNLPKVGAQVERSATQGPGLRGSVKSKPPAKAQAPAAKPQAPAAKPTSSPNTLLRGVKGAGSALRGAAGLAGASLTAAAIPLVIKEMVDRQNRYNKEAAARPRGVRTGTASGRTGRGGTTADRQSSAPTRGASSVATDGRYIPGSQQQPISRPSAPTRSSGGNPPAPGSSRQASSGGSSRPAPRPSSPQTSTGTAGKGQSWADFNPGRGTSKTNNPLIKNDQWMMQRMKDREANQQASDSQKVGNRFDTSQNVYSPSTKVDGSAFTEKSGSDKLKSALEKQRDKEKQRQQQQQQLAASRKPGSRY